MYIAIVNQKSQDQNQVAKSYFFEESIEDGIEIVQYFHGVSLTNLLEIIEMYSCCIFESLHLLLLLLRLVSLSFEGGQVEEGDYFVVVVLGRWFGCSLEAVEKLEVGWDGVGLGLAGQDVVVVGLSAYLGRDFQFYVFFDVDVLFLCQYLEKIIFGGFQLLPRSFPVPIISMVPVVSPLVVIPVLIVILLIGLMLLMLIERSPAFISLIILLRVPFISVSIIPLLLLLIGRLVVVLGSVGVVLIRLVLLKLRRVVLVVLMLLVLLLELRWEILLLRGEGLRFKMRWVLRLRVLIKSSLFIVVPIAIIPPPSIIVLLETSIVVGRPGVEIALTLTKSLIASLFGVR